MHFDIVIWSWFDPVDQDFVPLLAYFHSISAFPFFHRNLLILLHCLPEEASAGYKGSSPMDVDMWNLNILCYICQEYVKYLLSKTGIIVVLQLSLGGKSPTSTFNKAPICRLSMLCSFKTRHRPSWWTRPRAFWKSMQLWKTSFWCFKWLSVSKLKFPTSRRLSKNWPKGVN